MNIALSILNFFVDFIKIFIQFDFILILLSASIVMCLLVNVFNFLIKGEF